MAHLNECHELLEMLKRAMDEGDDEDEFDDDEYALDDRSDEEQ